MRFWSKILNKTCRGRIKNEVFGQQLGVKSVTTIIEERHLG